MPLRSKRTNTMARINQTFIAELAPVGSTARGQARRAEIVERRIESRNTEEAKQAALSLAAKVSTEKGQAYGVIDVYGV